MISADYTEKKRPKNYLGSLKVAILGLTPISVILGTGAAFHLTGFTDKNSFLLLMAGVITGHLSVIDFNDFFDYQFGHKMDAREIPFGEVLGEPAGTESSAQETLVLALVFFAISSGICIYFTVLRGIPVLLLWLAGFILLRTYPAMRRRLPLVAAFYPGTGIGIIIVLLSFFSMSGSITTSALIISLIPFFLVNGFFLLSHFMPENVSCWEPLHIKNGRLLSGWLYGLCITGAYATLIFGRGFDAIPSDSLIAIMTTYFALPAVFGAMRYSQNVEELIPFTVFSLIICFIMPLLVALGLFFG